MQRATLETQPTNSFRVFSQIISRAIDKLRRKIDVEDELTKAQVLLETLPLSTEEFGIAASRMRNADRYLRSQEYGAANWELIALRTHFSKSETARCG
jgi:hypothetical protein